jgi:phosphomannomutase
MRSISRRIPRAPATRYPEGWNVMATGAVACRSVRERPPVSQLIISVSGLRGIIGETLDPEVALRYARAVGAELGPGPIVLARDGRATGGLLLSIAAATLHAAGRDVLIADVAATPTVGVLVRTHQAAGALQISASHNPPEYNGIKVFGADGRVVSAEVGTRIADRYRQGEGASWTNHARQGRALPIEDTIGDHARWILATVDVERIRQQRYRVLLDANHGAGARLGRFLLEQLGCDLQVLGEEPHGRFTHPPEPIADNLRDVQQQVRAQRAVIGFCQDPDADRLVIIDERGEFIGEEYTLALCLAHRLGQSAGPVVTNCATSRMAQDLAERAGATFHRAAVGEAHVADRMIAEQALFGGEGNGGPIDPRIGYVRDSFVGMALVLDAMAHRQVGISQLVAELPRYAIHKAKVSLADRPGPPPLARLRRHFSDATADELDGLRLDWPDRWLLIRGSNTEPILRIISEAPTAEEAQQLCREAERILTTSA